MHLVSPVPPWPARCEAARIEIKYSPDCLGWETARPPRFVTDRSEGETVLKIARIALAHATLPPALAGRAARSLSLPDHMSPIDGILACARSRSAPALLACRHLDVVRLTTSDHILRIVFFCDAHQRARAVPLSGSPSAAARRSCGREAPVAAPDSHLGEEPAPDIPFYVVSRVVSGFSGLRGPCGAYPPENALAARADG